MKKTIFVIVFMLLIIAADWFAWCWYKNNTIPRWRLSGIACTFMPSDKEKLRLCRDALSGTLGHHLDALSTLEGMYEKRPCDDEMATLLVLLLKDADRWEKPSILSVLRSYAGETVGENYEDWKRWWDEREKKRGGETLKNLTVCW